MTHGPVGDSASGLDYEESEHSGRVVRIASVAALGGLLFGYDSAVINGAVSARFRTSSRSATLDARYRGRLGTDRRRAGAVRRRPAGRQDRPAVGDEDRRGAVPDQCLRHRPGAQRLDGRSVPRRRRHRRRRGVGHRTRLHRRDVAAAHPRAARLAAAVGDRDRHLRIAGDRLRCWRILPADRARSCGWAWRPGGGCSS